MTIYEIAVVRDYNYLFIPLPIGIVQLLGNGARFRKPNTTVDMDAGYLLFCIELLENPGRF